PARFHRAGPFTTFPNTQHLIPKTQIVSNPVTLPGAPRLFLVDGFALIYRAFFALLSRPLATSRGENTSAAWGVATFLRLVQAHKPDYLGWGDDSGVLF